MRLLELKNHGEVSLTKYLIKDIPPYAILSHTWGEDDEEVTFQDLTQGVGKSKAGYEKIRFCREQAEEDGLQYVWIDTCCIDKSDATELSEALNSMFRWYNEAAQCYVYLSDVSACGSGWESAFRKSRWFTRGWTLQELLAPKSVGFFSVERKRLGDKNSLGQQVCEITGIPIDALQGNSLSSFSVSARISWAENRETKREEDKAYSLMGIFSIHMVPMYGEGKSDAFRRLYSKIEKWSHLQDESWFNASPSTGLTMQFRDLSKTVLSLHPRCSQASKSLDIPQNQPFITREETEAPKRRDRDTTPHLIPPKIKITIQTDKIPLQKARGWIFGSDPEKCDYLLDTDRKRGVSRTHFEIYHNWESMVLMIKNLSSNQLVINADERGDIINRGDKRALCQVDCYIEVGLLIFNLEIPDRGQLQSLYEDNLEVYRKIVKGGVPDVASLAVKQQGKDTPAVKGLLATSTSASTNKYHRRWTIGNGSTGIVYNAIDRFSGREVALKEFYDRRTALRISLEIKILDRVKHVHITRYIEVVENPSLLLVMEFVGGGSLADLQNVSRRETLLMAQQTSQALSYLHDQHITHRDIKPANILIVFRGRDFHCKVADFGESSEDESTLTTFCGTSLYQAPEIIKPPYSKTVDIWSLGIIVVQLWYDWFPLCLHELSDTRDSWLADTERVDTFQRNMFMKWTAPIMTRWHDFLHRKLKEEMKRHCSMAQTLLHMLEVDPMERYSASQSRYHLDRLPLPDEPPGPHKRNAELAELDVPNASRPNSEHSTIGPVSLRAISEEPPEAVGSQYQPAVSKAAPLRNPPEDIATPPKRSRELKRRVGRSTKAEAIVRKAKGKGKV